MIVNNLTVNLDQTIIVQIAIERMELLKPK